MLLNSFIFLFNFSFSSLNSFNIFSLIPLLSSPLFLELLISDFNLLFSLFKASIFCSNSFILLFNLFIISILLSFPSNLFLLFNCSFNSLLFFSKSFILLSFSSILKLYNLFLFIRSFICLLRLSLLFSNSLFSFFNILFSSINFFFNLLFNSSILPWLSFMLFSFNSFSFLYNSCISARYF